MLKLNVRLFILQLEMTVFTLAMLVKVNNIDIDKNKVRVSKLDIDDYGSVIALTKLELKIPANDNSIIQHLANGITIDVHK